MVPECFHFGYYWSTDIRFIEFFLLLEIAWRATSRQRTKTVELSCHSFDFGDLVWSPFCSACLHHISRKNKGSKQTTKLENWYSWSCVSFPHTTKLWKSSSRPTESTIWQNHLEETCSFNRSRRCPQIGTKKLLLRKQDAKIPSGRRGVSQILSLPAMRIKIRKVPGRAHFDVALRQICVYSSQP